MDILFNRHVNFVDEVEEIIHERGGQTRHQTVAAVHKAFPQCGRESEEAGEQRLRAFEAAVARHEAEVEAPALAILRERKAAAASRTTTSSSTATGWRKEPVIFAADAGYYRKLLDGVDPVLPEQLAAAPAVNSLTLRVSWPRGHCAATGFIASSHENLLALCVGSCYRHDWRHLPGCYLVLDTRAKSVAAVPTLPDCWARPRVINDDGEDDTKHFHMGSAGVAVLRTDDAHGGGGGGYLLAELYRHTDRDEFPTNKATLFIWFSPGSGGGRRAGADQWIRKVVALPFPVPGPDEYCFNFTPGTVFAVSSTSLCWVDVWAGILICNNMSSSTAAAAAAGDDDDDDGLVFTFIPLPEGCAPRSFGSTGYRSVCCVDSETIRLLCMDDGGGEVTLAVTTWILKSPLTESWRWEKDEDASCASLCVADLLDDAIPEDDDEAAAGGGNGGKQRRRRLLRRVVRWPVVGRAQPGVAHVAVHDVEYRRKEKEWQATASYQVSLDVARRSVASVVTFPAGSSSTPRGHMLMAL